MSTNQNDPKETFLNTRELAKKLGMSHTTLTTWRSTQRYSLPYVKLRRRVLYRLSDVEEFLRQRTVVPHE